jgi:hypothetical protein
MQTPHTKPILRKRAAPEGIATQSRTKVQKLAQPTVGAECLFLNKLAQELRDHIYDYVAMTETKIGLYVNFMESKASYAQSNKKRRVQLSMQNPFTHRLMPHHPSFSTIPFFK